MVVIKARDITSLPKKLRENHIQVDGYWFQYVLRITLHFTTSYEFNVAVRNAKTIATVEFVVRQKVSNRRG